jgi:tetrahydromethanopterin S-methyltransferase subunit A
MVIDNPNPQINIPNYPYVVTAVTAAAITGTVAGNATLNIVCAGLARRGRVVDAQGNVYNVKLPGAFHGLIVTFNRA